MNDVEPAASVSEGQPPGFDARWQSLRTPALWLGLLAVLALVTRPPLPVDETRYLTVAWEMWNSGNLLVPHLNGLPYSDKPPLLFWLIQAGWAAFGVNEWWPRLLPAWFSVGSLAMVSALGRRLGLGGRRGLVAAPVVLGGFLLWVLFTLALMFDLILGFFVLVGILGLVKAVRRERWGWLLVAIAVGAGLLTKGPVILLHLAGPALLAPWWGRSLRGERLGGRYYGAFFLALLGGLAIAAAWAIPAALFGGDEYRRAILVDQTAGRVVQSFAHRRPWFWYLPLLPVLCFPYSLWPPLWRVVARLRGSGASADPLVRLVIAWTLPALVAFSLISGKQPQYLLPLLPGAALFVAWALARAERPARRDAWWALAPAVAIAVAVLLAPALPQWPALPPWASQVAPGGGLLALVGLVAVARLQRHHPELAGARLGLVPVVLVAGLLIAFSPVLGAAYDVRPTAAYLKVLQTQGRPVARVRNNEGEFGFAGRLERPLEVIPSATTDAWLALHPNGVVVEELRDVLTPEQLQGAALVVPYRTKQWVVWEKR